MGSPQTFILSVSSHQLQGGNSCKNEGVRPIYNDGREGVMEKGLGGKRMSVSNADMDDRNRPAVDIRDE